MIIVFADLRVAIDALHGRDDFERDTDASATWDAAIDRVLELVDQHAERAAADVVGGKDELRRAGKHVGGDVPYGRQLGEDGQTLLDHEAEGELVRLARELRARGMSYGAVSRELAGRKMLARTGAPLAPAQIRRFCLAADARDRAAGVDPRAQPAPAPATRGTRSPSRGKP